MCLYREYLSEERCSENKKMTLCARMGGEQQAVVSCYINREAKTESLKTAIFTTIYRANCKEIKIKHTKQKSV